MVYFHYLVCLLHRSSTYRWYKLNELFFMASYHLCGTQVNLSARLQLDLTNVTSTDRLYSVTSFLIASNLLFIILLPAFVCILALPVKVSNTQWYMHKESLYMQLFNLPLEC